MFVALISVTHISHIPGKEVWSIPVAGNEKYTHEHWVIRSGPGMDVYESDDWHDIVDRVYWERQEP